MRSVKRATVYFEPEIHRALRLKAAASDKSISDMVNYAVTLTLANDADDIEAIESHKREPNLDFERFVYSLRQLPVEDPLQLPAVELRARRTRQRGRSACGLRRPEGDLLPGSHKPRMLGQSFIARPSGVGPPTDGGVCPMIMSRSCVVAQAKTARARI